MKESLSNFNFGSSQQFRMLDLLIKMLSLTLKSTRLSSINKKKFITILGILTKMNVKISIETPKQNFFNEKENMMKKWSPKGFMEQQR